MKLYGIVGAGGFGREVMSIASAMFATEKKDHDYEIMFVVENLVQETVTNGVKTISDLDFLAYEADTKYFNVAIADSRVRERITDKMIQAGIVSFPIIAPNSLIMDFSSIGEGSIFCPFTTVTTNVKIGRFFHANIYSYVAHDCVIGDYVTFAPGVQCNGRVVIEDHAYIGAGAMIKQGTDAKPMIIGKGSVIGMGAVVTKSIQSFTTVVGNPAVEIKK